MTSEKRSTRFPAIAEPYWGVIFILVVNSINYYLTYSVIRFNLFFLATYTIYTLQGLITWYACYWVIFRLDKYLPYEENFLKRVSVQVLLTSVVTLSLITGLTVLTNVLFTSEPMQQWYINEQGEQKSGLGLLTDTFNGRFAFGHGGAGLGAGSALYYFPHNGAIVFLSVNLGTLTKSPGADQAEEAQHRILELLVQ
ncbi:hypothetical protein [Pontibacter beigongshangensis]|uniref:hypothetical protein n=1 Tax=Pontibacter beigongshangensis TaxID=2574733 RepID=UPI00164EE7E9|nr:hypothetical protein [Pontibacter beigongshangensis]